MPKLKEVRESKNKTQKELAKDIGIEKTMVSRFEVYRCLPTPNTLRLITEALECGVDDIYEPQEIYLQRKNAPKRKRKKSYKLTVSLTPELKAMIHDAISRCGYKSITDWVMYCCGRLQKQYEEILAKEKGSTTDKESL